MAIATKYIIRWLADLGEDALPDAKDKGRFKRLPHEAFLFLVKRAFSQNIRDEVAYRYYKAFKKAVETFRSKRGLRSRRSLIKAIIKNPDAVLPIFRKRLSHDLHYKMRDIYKPLVKSALKFIESLPGNYDHNIIRYAIAMIKGGKAKLLFKEIDGIEQVGSKIGRYFISEVVLIYGLRKALSKEDVDLILPVDTWVRKVWRALWGNLPDKKLRQKARVVSRRTRVRPEYLERGSWKLGVELRKAGIKLIKMMRQLAEFKLHLGINPPHSR